MPNITKNILVISGLLVGMVLSFPSMAHTFTFSDPNNKTCNSVELGVEIHYPGRPMIFPHKVLEIMPNQSKSYNEDQDGPILVKIIATSINCSDFMGCRKFGRYTGYLATGQNLTCELNSSNLLECR